MGEQNFHKKVYINISREINRGGNSDRLMYELLILRLNGRDKMVENHATIPPDVHTPGFGRFGKTITGYLND